WILKQPRNSVEVSRKYGEHIKCLESGIFADTKNCKRFYRCNTLLGVHPANVFDCLDDHVYSINQKKCIYLENSDRPECSAQTQSRPVPQPQPQQPELISQPWLQPQPQPQSQFSKGSDTTDSHGIESTDSDNDSEIDLMDSDDDSDTNDSCETDSTNSDDDTDTMDSYGIESTDSDNDSDTTDSYENEEKDHNSFTYVTVRENEDTTLSVSTTTIEDSIEEQTCVREGFFPDLENCSKFYRCVVVGSILVKYQFSCPVGTFWDNWKETCNFPRQIQNLDMCKREKQPEIAVPVQFLMPKIEDNPIIGNLSEDKFTIVCPTGFRRHSKYCNLFYQCVVNNNMQGSFILFGCSKGAIFDEKRLLCADVTHNCAKFEFDKQSSSIIILHHSNEVLCPREGQFPYNKICSSKYFKCIRNEHGILEGYLVDCPAGNVYSSLSNYCVPPTLFPYCTNYYQI
ncbi:unnamed protein product, partial [Heterotrigona itama]